jgi:hypothetical protein
MRQRREPNKNRARVWRADPAAESLEEQSMSSIAPAQGSRNSVAYVYDGQQCLGHVLARGKTGFEAFDPNDKSLGVFPTQRQAANALLIEAGGP